MEISQETSGSGYSCLLYGPPGIGKTTLAARAQSPLIFNIENGLRGIDLKQLECSTTNHLRNYSEIKTFSKKFGEQQKFETIVYDSLSKLQELMIQSICAEANKSTLAEFGYGAGYQRFSQEVSTLCMIFDDLKSRGKNVILIAHEMIESVQDPEAEQFDRFNCSLDKRVGERIRANVDHIFHMHHEKTVNADRKQAKLNRVMLQTRPSGGVIAKTRGNNEKFIETRNDETDRQIWGGL